MPFLIIYIILETLVFIGVGKLIGFGLALTLLILGSIIGFIMMRRMNLTMMQRLQKKMERGELPLKEMMGMPFKMMAGVLLIIPGFITDILAICCFIPLTRNWLFKILMKSKLMKKKGANFNMQNFQNMQMNTGLHKRREKAINQPIENLEDKENK
jgi:UPF0716 protein FxsA